MTKTYICIPAVEQQHRGSRLHAFMHLSQQFDEKMSVCASFCHKKNHSLLAVIFFWTVLCVTVFFWQRGGVCIIVCVTNCGRKWYIQNIFD